VRRLVLAFGLVLAMAPAAAEAVTIKDIIDLTKAGLGDDVLLALIDVDARVFSIDNDTLAQLKQAGVSERVIVAMIRSGRTAPAQSSDQITVQPTPPPTYDAQQDSPYGPAGEPQVIVRQVEVPVAVPVPVYVTVPAYGYGASVYGYGRRRVPVINGAVVEPARPGAGLPASRGWITDTHVPTRQEPVYWGSGGKLRPDAWRPRD
jgi:hypothetical protein